MEWDAYLTFAMIALVIALTPGSDTAVALKNSLQSGRRGGMATSFGVTAAAAVQAALAAAGLGILIAQSQLVLQAVRWIGVAYLAWMAFQALRSAWKGHYPEASADGAAARRGFRQGFLVNLTNPQVLLFYLAILPQFMTPGMELWALSLLAITHPVLGFLQLFGVVMLVHAAARWVQRRSVRRTLDAATGAALGLLSARVALDAA
ncbi:MAG: LysE family translocator [Nesterenkonia sp.]